MVKIRRGGIRGRAGNYHDYNTSTDGFNRGALQKRTSSVTNLTPLSRFLCRLNVRDRAKLEGWHGTDTYIAMLEMLNVDDRSFIEAGLGKVVPILETVVVPRK